MNKQQLIDKWTKVYNEEPFVGTVVSEFLSDLAQIPDETQPDSLPVAGDGKPFEFIKFPGEKGSEISSHNDETELEHLLLKVKDTSGFDQWLKGKNIELSPEEKKAAIVIFQAGINYAAASHPGSVDAVGLNEAQVLNAIGLALHEFKKWNDITGALAEGTSWHMECESVIEDAVHIGIQMALYGKVDYHEDEDRNPVQHKSYAPSQAELINKTGYEK